MSRAQLVAAGCSPSAADRLCRSGALSRIAASVYVVRGAPTTYDTALWHAVLATGGVLGFATAAWLWGCLDSAPDRIDVIVARSDHPRPIRGVRLRRRDYPHHRFTRRQGLPITTRTDSLLDHLGSLRGSPASQLGDRALQRGWLVPDDFAHRLRTRPGQQGNPTLRRLLAQTGDGAAAHSERILHRLLRRAGITQWQANVPIWHEGRLIGVADVLIRAAGLIIEIDGMAFHTDPERFQRDRSRQNDLIAAGWRILRFTWSDLSERPGYVIARVRQQLDAAA